MVFYVKHVTLYFIAPLPRSSVSCGTHCKSPWINLLGATALQALFSSYFLFLTRNSYAIYELLHSVGDCENQDICLFIHLFLQ